MKVVHKSTFPSSALRSERKRVHWGPYLLPQNVPYPSIELFFFQNYHEVEVPVHNNHLDSYATCSACKPYHLCTYTYTVHTYVLCGQLSAQHCRNLDCLFLNSNFSACPSVSVLVTGRDNFPLF